jgi:hypothetical protein
LLRDRLAEQHGALLYAKHEAATATEADALRRGVAGLPKGSQKKAPDRCYLTSTCELTTKSDEYPS